MSELALPALAPTAAYPEQEVERPGLLDRVADGIAAPFARRLATRRVAGFDIAAAVRQFAKEAEKLVDRDILPDGSSRQQGPVPGRKKGRHEAGLFA